MTAALAFSSVSSTTHVSDTKPISETKTKIPLEIAEQSFNTLTIRYSLESREILEGKLGSLPDREEKVNQVVVICESGKIDDNFLQETVFDLYALQAVREGKLSKDQFCSIMAVKAGLEEKGITPESFEEVPLFVGGAINPRAWTILSKTNKVSGRQGITYLTLYQLSDLFLAMEKEGIPASEQKLYIIPDTRRACTLADIKRLGIRAFNNKNVRITHSVELEAFFSFLISCKIDGQKYRVIPSHSLRQTVLNQHYGENALEMLTVISPSTVYDLREAQMKNTRDYAVPFFAEILGSEYPTPLIADKYWATKLDFVDHDWYHAWTASGIPEKQRKVSLSLSRLFEQDSEFKYSEMLGNCLADLEFSDYRKEIGTSKDSDQKFWAALNNTVVLGLQINTLSQVAIQDFLESNLYKKLCVYIVENQSDWSKAGITLRGLQELSKSFISAFTEQLKGSFGGEATLNNIRHGTPLCRLCDDLSKMAIKDRPI